MRPVAQHAEADKVFTLTVDLLRGIFAALGAEFSGGEFLTWLTVLLLDFQLDRQTVAVPARNVRRVIARQSFGLNDNVFQNLVNRVTNMNAAIRIRRAIMQKPRKIPQRMCVGCREKRDKKDLLRVVRTPEGQLVLDATGKKSGRGAYVCRDPQCLKKARKSRALDRMLEVSIPDEVYEALERQMETEA